jgi:hypothetical protein
LTPELEKQRDKYEDAQMAIKSMEMALVVSSYTFFNFLELLYLHLNLILSNY